MGAVGVLGVLGVLPQRVPGLGCASSPHGVGLGEAPYTAPARKGQQLGSPPMAW